MSNSSTSNGGSLMNKSPRASTSAGALEVSTIDSSGNRTNVSVQCQSTHERISIEDVGRHRKRRILIPRTKSESTLSPDSRPLSVYRKSGKLNGNLPTTTEGQTVSPTTKTHTPRSVKHNRLQTKLRKYVLDSDPDQMRQQLREAQGKILELEQKIQLKSAETTGLKRQIHELKETRRDMFEQLRNSNDQVKDIEEERDSVQERYRSTKQELRSKKVCLKEKETEIKLLESRLKESTELLGCNLTTMKKRSPHQIVKTCDDPQPSTSLGMSDTHITPTNDGSIFQDIISNFKELLENHLQCSICNEVSYHCT